MTADRASISNAVHSFWASDTNPPDGLRTTEDLPTEADIVIVGAGFAGAVTAYHILISPSSFLQPSILILILDARKICSGATGQDSGCVKPDLYYKKMFHQLLVKLLDQEHKLNV